MTIDELGRDDDRGLRVAAVIRQLRRTIQSGALRARAYGDISDLRQMDTIDALGECDGLRVGELAVALRVDNSTATRAVQQLERSGLVARVEDFVDGRAVRVVLTSAGRERQAHVRTRRRAVMATLLRNFTVAEQDQLIDLISRLVGAMDREARQPSRAPSASSRAPITSGGGR